MPVVPPCFPRLRGDACCGVRPRCGGGDTPASANGGFRPSLLSACGFRSAAREGSSGGCSVPRSHRPGLARRLPAAVLVSVIACVCGCRTPVYGQLVEAVKTSQRQDELTCCAPAVCSCFARLKHSEQNTGLSPRGRNGTSVSWPQLPQVAGCIWRGVRPPKLAAPP